MQRVPMIAITCVLATLSLSCDDRQEVYPASQPSGAAVAGKYAVVGDSQVMKQHGAKGMLDLRHDGTFLMRKMPGWGWERDLLGRDKTWSGQGTWSITNQGRVPPNMPRFVLRLDFDKITGTSETLGDSTPYLVGKAKPYDIHISIGDPDGGRVLILRKTEEPVSSSD